MTTPVPPVDQAARDAVARILDQTLFVEAGAGTGKTSALVGRIVALAGSGVAMRNIAAITFTEAAAAELRDRVREALEEGARTRPDLVVAAAEVDEAAISTLHSFAQRLITDHPLEAGLPPAIEVLDEIESALEFEERWVRFVDALHGDPDAEDLLVRSFAAELPFDRLRVVAAVFDDQRDRLPAVVEAPPPLRPLDAAPFRATLDAAADVLGDCRDGDDTLARRCAAARDLAERLDAATDDLDALGAVVARSSERADGKLFPGNKGNKTNWGDPDAARAAIAAAEEAGQQWLREVRQEILAHLVHRIGVDARSAAADRRRRGRLVFHDLLVAARDLLRGSAEVRRAVAERYRHLLIDEFQDTDPIQVELAVLLATSVAEVGDTAWTDLPLQAGRLFFVGDPKQSIYRFRRADIALFLQVREAVTSEALQLSTNFRSDPSILAWVNATFASLMPGGVAGQATYHPLDAGREPPPGADPDPTAVWVLGHAHAKGRSIAEVREAEAADLAAAISSAVGRWEVADRAPVAGGDERRRPARWEDVAVLIPTRTSLPYLEQAFDDLEVPYRVESSSLVWGTQQVRDLLAVLQAVDDPTDEVALVAALRSPALACSDDDLLAFRAAGGRWDLTRPPPEALDATQPVVTALAHLRSLHDRRWWVGVSALVDAAVRDLGFFELAVAHRRPRDHWRRLRFVVDQARRFEDTPGATLRGFLRWAERQADDGARVREPVLPETDDDAVRILTVHGSKGLEFPIVVLAGLNRAADPRVASVLWDDAGTVQVKISRFETEGFTEVSDAEKAMSDHERHRLLYVAATRARDHLVLSVHRKEPTRPDATDADLLLHHAEASGAVHRTLPDPTLALRSPPPTGPTLEDADRPGARQQWDAERVEILERGRRQPVIGATALAGLLGADDGKTEPDRDTTPHRRGRAGTAIGRAVHATLQSVDLDDPQGLDEVAAAQAAAEGLPEVAAEVARLTRAAVTTEIVRTAVAHPHWRELYVAVPVDATTVEGFVDLLYDGPDGLVVVDYKTDRVTDETDVDDTVARYRLQLGTYALALEELLGRPVAGAALLFVRGPEARTRWVPDLAGAVAEVRARAATTAR